MKKGNIHLEIFKKNEKVAFFLKNILRLEKSVFPKSWLYKDAKDYYKKRLENEDCINLFLYDSDKVIGYCLCLPLEKEFKDLKKHHKTLKKTPNTLYIETIEILPNYRGHGLLKLILRKIEKTAMKRKYKFIALHSRTTNNLDKKMIKILPNVVYQQNIKKWYFGGNEPYKYLLIKI